MRRFVVGLAGVVGFAGLSASSFAQPPAVPATTPATTPAAVSDGAKALDGVWSPVSVQSDGAEQMDAKSREVIRLSIENGEYKIFVVTDAAGMKGKRVSTATLTADGTTGEFELAIQDGLKKGQKLHGIYEVADGQLKLAYSPAGQARPTKYESAKGDGVFVETWARVKGK